jgi:hypothetical protein
MEESMSFYFPIVGLDPEDVTIEPITIHPKRKLPIFY